MAIRRKLKSWFAAKLAPSMALDARRYARLRMELEYDRHWLAYDFPEVGAFAQRALDNDANYWRALDEKPKATRWSWDIGNFREQLRRGEAQVGVSNG